MFELVKASGRKQESGRTRRSLAIWIACAFLLLLGLAAIGLQLSRPYLKKFALEVLREKFHANVQIDRLDITGLLPVRVSGKGLSLRQDGRTDTPPLIQVAEFSAEAEPLSLLRKPVRIDLVALKGLVITIPPKGQRRGRVDWSRVKDVPVLVYEMVSDDAVLDMIPKDQDKPHHIFELHHILMHYLGLHRAASFSAELTNPTPPGEIDTKGNFGPWNSDDPGQTPLSANYTFTKADLGVFKGISGILSSDGQFGGVLDSIEIVGETETPDFTVEISGHPVALHTNFSATVDGTNGNTILHPVRAKFLHSVVMANGEIAKKPGDKGRSIVLDVATDGARMEDMLYLAVKSKEPLMTGDVNLHTKFDLPPGEGDLIERLRLNGVFGVHTAEFTDPKVNEKVETLSRKGLGKPKDEDAGSGISDLKGQFGLASSRLSFRNLTFAVQGASVQMNGNYGLRSEEIDFHGKLRLQAKLSQTMTGFKSFLLKPFDPFFRKNNLTEVPIKATGTRSQPSFGLDFHHHDGKNETAEKHTGDN